MKNLIKKSFKPIVAVFTMSLVFIACETNPVIKPQEEILPTSFGLDVPNSLSNQGAVSGRISGRTTEDILQGNDIYQQLALFIAIGDGAADIVEEIIFALSIHNIDRILTLSYESDEDGRVKNLVVFGSPDYEGTVYEFGLTITDAESEGNSDGGYAMQIFWNRSPIKGVAILKPFNIDRENDANAADAIYKIAYDSDSNLGYDAHMIVTIANLPLADPTDDLYAMSTLKMFVGKSGSTIDVFGNSDHPNAQFFNDDTGFNWAFVAAGYEDQDFGVAEVGLPPSNLDESSRTVLLDTYSLKNVFTDQITDAFPNIDQGLLDLYLMNTDGPGYFTDEGFVAGGTPPANLWDELLLRIENLTPYNPADISNVQIDFL